MTNSVKVALFQFNPTVGDIVENTNKIIAGINSAIAKGCNLFITSELAICGYSPEDLLFRANFYQQINQQLKRLLTFKDITLIIGCPYQQMEHTFNSAMVINSGQITHRYDKKCLANYGVFDEKRYFTVGQQQIIFELNGIKIGVLICEDLWHQEQAINLQQAGAQLICVLNASPYWQNKHTTRLELVKSLVKQIKIPIIYVNQFGGQDEVVYDGSSFIMLEDQQIQLPAFVECNFFATIDYLDQRYSVSCKPVAPANYDSTQLLYQALTVALKDYVTKNNFAGVILGLSGGIDSALTLAIAYDALGSDKIMALMMPSIYTAAISKEDARAMAHKLKIKYHEIEITDLFNQFKTTLSLSFAGTAEDTTEENIQARIRGTLLMALSNKFGFLVITTGNKSEMATGYATLYGDMAGGFALLKDVLKVDVYKLAKWRNLQTEIIPHRIITRPPSAELRADQTDQDSLPPYPLLDRIIELLVENNLSQEEIINLGFAPDVVNKIARLIKVNEYKRRQAAIGPKISKVSFARDWRYPITNKFNF
ncbi:MAG: NAD+ synthase [Burkholderiales bacterium]|nr:NAD+ synthase [Burkholderiales bacterium]